MMKANLKTIWGFVLTFALIWIGLAHTAHAAEITPMYVNANTVKATLTLGSNRSTTIKGSVQALNTSYAITGTLSVERKSGTGAWSTYKSWTSESAKGSMTQTKTATLPAGYTYRAKFSVNVAGEAITKYSETV